MNEADGDRPVALAPIPSDALLLHIGVFKTGTTALQMAFRSNQTALKQTDVYYRGPHSWHYKGLPKVIMRDGALWRALQDDITSAPGRRVVSSENLCSANEQTAMQALEGLHGGRPVHILITVRSLADLLTSTWQQFLKRGLRTPLTEWLDAVATHPDIRTSTATGYDARGGIDWAGRFWLRNDFPRLLDKWGALVGAENVTFIVSDKRDPERLLRASEQLLDLPPHGLTFSGRARSNPSLNAADAELLRAVNQQVGDWLPPARYRKLVRLGVFPGLIHFRGPKSEAILLPEQISALMNEIGSAQASVLRHSPAAIVGDIDDLGRTFARTTPELVPPTQVDIDRAASAIERSLRAANTLLDQAEERRRKEVGKPTRPAPAPTTLARVRRRLRSYLR